MPIHIKGSGGAPNEYVDVTELYVYGDLNDWIWVDFDSNTPIVDIMPKGIEDLDRVVEVVGFAVYYEKHWTNSSTDERCGLAFSLVRSNNSKAAYVYTDWEDSDDPSSADGDLLRATVGSVPYEYDQDVAMLTVEIPNYLQTPESDVSEKVYAQVTWRIK